MAGRDKRSELVFAALPGGLIASFVGMSTYTAMMQWQGGAMLIAAVLAGDAAAAVFMLSGARVVANRAWLGEALIFAGGFTTLWSVALSFAAEPKWAVLAGLAALVAAGIYVGFRFWQDAEEPADSPGEAAWTR